jgi:hypothetical protein
VDPTTLALIFLEAHSVDGRTLRLNPAQITQLVEPRDAKHRLLTTDVNCIVRLADGTYVSVVESCAEIARLVDLAR